MATEDRSFASLSAQKLRPKWKTLLHSATASRRGHWPLAGARTNGARTSARMAIRRAVYSKAGISCNAWAEARKLPAHTRQMTRMSSRSRRGMGDPEAGEGRWRRVRSVHRDPRQAPQGFRVARPGALDHFRRQPRTRRRLVPTGRLEPVAHDLLVIARRAGAHFVLVGRPIARGVRGQHLVHDVEPPVGIGAELE